MDGWLYCSHKGCRRRIKNEHWNKVQAHDLGWMMQKNGDNWCPDHPPEWLAEWREKKGKK